MANETLTANLAGIIEDIEAESLMILNDLVEGGILSMVRRVDTEGKQGKTVDFPQYGAVASSDVAEVAEGTDHTTNKQLTNTETEATVAEHVIKSFISDLAVMSTSERNDIVEDASTMFANAMLAKLEDDIVGLFSGFSQTVAGAATTMTLAHWYSAIRQIKAANGDIRNLGAVISPKQYYDAKGLRALLVDNSGESKLSEDFLNRGFVDNPFGMKVKISNEINENVAAGGDAAGGIFAKGAIGVHTKGLFGLEAERDASARGFELVGVGRWKEVEVYNNWGIYFLSDVS